MYLFIFHSIKFWTINKHNFLQIKINLQFKKATSFRTRLNPWLKWVLGQLTPRKIVPNPNGNPKPNPYRNQWAIVWTPLKLMLSSFTSIAFTKWNFSLFHRFFNFVHSHWSCDLRKLIEEPEIFFGRNGNRLPDQRFFL